MRKYNMNSDNPNPSGSPQINPASRWSGRALPFFDIPCLYYPQYSCEWGNCGSQNAYAVFGISTPDGGDSNLEFHLQVQDGRHIQLDSDGETILLQPGKLYLAVYHVSAAVDGSLSVIPVVDCISDFCNASHASGTVGTVSNQSVSSSFLLPVVETVSSFQLLLNTNGSTVEQLSGSVSIVALADL